MNLKEYHLATQISFAKIAKDCGATRARISQIANDGAPPSYSLAVGIERATSGMVQIENWFPRRMGASIQIGGITA